MSSFAFIFMGVTVSLWAAVAPPTQMDTRRVPPIPEALAKQAAPYLQVRTLRFQDWQLAGTNATVLITQRPLEGEVSQLHVLNKPKGQPRQVTFGKEPVRGAALNPVDDRALIYHKDVGGSERYQLFHHSLATGKSVRITDGMNRHTGAHWSPKGDRVAYFSPKRNGRDNDLYVADPQKPDSEKLLARLNGGGWWIEDWSRDGRLMILMEYISINESRLHIADAITGELSPLTPKLNIPVSHQNARFDPRMRAVFFSSDDGFEFQRLTRLDLSSGGYQYFLPHVRWDIEAIEVSPDGRRLAVAANEGGASKLRILDAASGDVLWEPKNPAGVIHQLTWASNTELMYGFEWALSPGRVVHLDVEAKEDLVWAESDLTGVEVDQLSLPYRKELRSADGSRFDAWVYLPGRVVGEQFVPTQPSRPSPVVIWYHGGPESQFRPRFLGRYNFLTVEEKVVLICPNVRGSRGYGKNFLKADNGKERAKVLLDIERIYNEVAANPLWDQNRIAVMGGSYGGFMALHSMVNLNNFVRCGIDVVGISNFVTFLENTSDYRRNLRRVEYGDERQPEMRKFLQDLSPLTHVGKVTRPLLIVQGANDPRVPASESAQIEAALRKKDIETWYLLAKDEGHGFRKRANRTFQFLTTIQFLRRHLMGTE